MSLNTEQQEIHDGWRTTAYAATALAVLAVLFITAAYLLYKLLVTIAAS